MLIGLRFSSRAKCSASPRGSTISIRRRSWDGAAALDYAAYELPLDGIRFSTSFKMFFARAMRLYLARKSAFAC